MSLPIPLNGLFGCPSNNQCVKDLMVDYPTQKISSVQLSVARKFPFDSISIKNQNCNAVDNRMSLDRGDGNGIRYRELEGEASCSSQSDARKEVTDRDRSSEFDVKGKGLVNHRPRGFRRRRKGGLPSGKHFSVTSSPNWITAVDQQDNHQSPSSIHKEQGGRIEDEVETLSVVKSNERYLEEFVIHKSSEGNRAKERITLDDDDDKENAILALARELEEEQAARAALYLELEKERNAAATAADEAMAMILRLQEEKASIEMESRQYQRMIEEKSTYDAEEMNLLKEILLRREREIHFLEKEVESYRQMIGLDNEQLNSGDLQGFTEDPDLMLHQLSMSLAKKKLSRLHEDPEFSKPGDLEKPLAEKTVPIVKEEQILERNVADVSEGIKDLHDLKVEIEPQVYDVHVVDDKPKLTDESNGNESQKPSADDTERGFLRRLDNETDRTRSSSETTTGLPPLSSRRSVRRNSTSALDSERTKIDIEVEWLRERLRIVQEGREKLNLSVDNREREDMQLKLLEDITRQLREIRLMTEPRKGNQPSLPHPSSKGFTKKRRCRSVSSGLSV